MEHEQSVIHNTFVIEKSYAAKPEKVFAAFADAQKKRRWFVESPSQTVESYELNFETGGIEKVVSKFTEGLPVVGGLSYETEGLYLEIQANRRFVVAQKMRIGGKCISAALCTVELLKTERGTDLLFTHQAAFFEGADGPEMRKRGWEKLFEQLEGELAN
jgi:uncharacterized protein YndB with AHSA1/START domain